jgi:hypothetical protein
MVARVRSALFFEVEINMSKLETLCLLLVLSITTATPAQLPAGSAATVPTSTASVAVAPVANPEPIVTQFKKTVVFVETECIVVDPTGAMKVVPYLGTGFLVLHHDGRFPAVQGFNYLVTNRHVAMPGIEDGAPCRVQGYKIRFNLKNAAADGSYSEVMSGGANVPWVYPSDGAIDLAVTPIGLDSAKYAQLTFPSSLFLTTDDAKKNQVVEGDSVLFTGLFVQFIGQVRSEPIVREGKIAMIPDEQVPTTLRSLGNIYLVDAHVFGGNSGSPMLVNLGGQRDNGLMAGFNYHRLGLISGYVQETSDFKLQAVAGYAGTVVANSGVAMVVPAQQILDLLNCDALLSLRQQQFAAMPPVAAPNTTTPHPPPPGSTAPPTQR